MWYPGRREEGNYLQIRLKSSERLEHRGVHSFLTLFRLIFGGEAKLGVSSMDS